MKPPLPDSGLFRLNYNLVRSLGLNNGVKQIADRVIVTQDLGLHTVHLRGLLLDALLEFSELVLQWLQHFFSDLLLVLQLLHARDSLFAPELVFFAH